MTPTDVAEISRAVTTGATVKLTEQSEALTGRVWRLVHRMLLREGVTEDHAMAVADVIRFEAEKELPAIEAAVRADALPTVEALAEAIVAAKLHYRLAEARGSARAILAALAATPAPAPEADRG